MTNRDLEVRPQDLSRVRAIKGALASFPAPRILEIVRQNPEIDVHQFCNSYLMGIDIKCYGGTRRAYQSLSERLLRARRKLGLAPPRAHQ